MDSKEETKMTTEIVPGGPAREEARELNRPKGSKPEGRWKRGALNTAAVGTAAFLGGTLAEQVHQVVNNPPPARVQEQKPDPKRDIPPEGIRFDAPVLKKRVFIPLVNKEYRELWPAEFGASERGVTLFNRGIQKGVKIEDQQLFENLLYFREKYGRPDLKLEINFYDSWDQMRLLAKASSYELSFETIPYDFWASYVALWDEQGNFIGTRDYPPTFEQYGFVIFRLKGGNVLEFHISLPVLRQGGIDPAPEQIRSVSRNLTSEYLLNIFISHEIGKGLGYFDSADLRTHPVVGRFISPSALLIVLK